MDVCECRNCGCKHHCEDDCQDCPCMKCNCEHCNPQQ